MPLGDPAFYPAGVGSESVAGGFPAAPAGARSSAPRLAILLATSALVAVACLLLSFRVSPFPGSTPGHGALGLAVRANAARWLLAGAVGAALAVAGALTPPGARARRRAAALFGVSAGAASGVALATVLWGGVAGPALAGIASGAGFGLLLARAHGLGRAVLLPLLWLGAVVAAGVGSAARDGFGGIALWLLGDVSGARLGGGLVAAVLVLGGTLALSHREEGDPSGDGGARIPSLLLFGLALGAAGPVAFVAWAARGIARATLGASASARDLLLAGAAVGATLLVAADALPRLAVGAYAMPLNVAIGVVGIPAVLVAGRARGDARPPGARGRVLVWTEALAIAAGALLLGSVALAYVGLIRSFA